MTRFPYRFAHGGPSTPNGIPVIYSRTLEFTHPHVTSLFIVQGLEGKSVAYTNDPDYQWTFYRAECHEQARKIVRDGIRRAVPWLRGT